MGSAFDLAMASLGDAFLTSPMARTDVVVEGASVGRVTLPAAIVSEGEAFELRFPGYAASVYCKASDIGGDVRDRDVVIFFSGLHAAECSYHVTSVERDLYGFMTIFLRLRRVGS